MRPSRSAHVRANDMKRKLEDMNDEDMLMLRNEYNYNIRLGDACWVAYCEPGEPPKLAPVLTTRLLSPSDRPEVCAVNGVFLYSTQYLRDRQMDYDRLIPDEMVGTDVYVLANRHVEVTGARPSSSWTAVPAGEETLTFIGAVRLANRATANQWRDQVLEFHGLEDEHDTGELYQHDVGSLLHKIGVPFDVPKELCARCPCVSAPRTRRRHSHPLIPAHRPHCGLV